MASLAHHCITHEVVSPLEDADMSAPVPPDEPPPHTNGSGFVEEWDRSMSTMLPVTSPTQYPAEKDLVSIDTPLSYHPEIVSPGLEAIHGADDGKEVVHRESPDQHAHQQEAGKFPVQDPALVKSRLRICGLTVPLGLALLALLLVALAIGLGVGLGLGLRRK